GTATWGAPPAAAPQPATATAAPSTVDGKAALAGQVLDTGGKPLSGVELSIDSATTTSGTDGRFVLRGLDAGHHELVIDATGIAAGDHGRFEEGVDLTAGRLSTLPWTTYLPAIDTTHAVPIPPTVRKRIVVRTPAIPGLSVVIPAGTRILDEDGKPVRALSITKIPLDRQPFPGAPGMPLAWTIQPGGAVVQGPGLKVTYPNITNQPAGTHIDYVDHDAARPGQGWAVYGGGRVSADGRFIVPDKQTRLHEIYLLGVSYDQPCLNAPDCPAPGEDGEDGDPVNLSTGLFTMTRTDLALPDVNPVALTRAYRQRDSVVRSFGIGQSDGFNLFMAPDPAGNYVLGLPDGEGIRFAPTGDGTYHALPTPTAFTGAVLATDNHTNFQVTLRSGTVYTFGSHSAKLIAITDRYGNTTTLDRDGSGTLQQVTSPNGRWLAFTWGACGGSSCIIRVSDNTGRSVRYNYDVSARMTSSVDPSGGVTSYVWAPCGTPLTCTELTAVTDPLGIQYLRNTYDGAGRIATQTQADGGVYRFAYTVDGTGLVTATSATDPKGVVRKVTFNTAGYTVSDTAAAGTSLQQTTTLTRDATSNLVTAVLDPAGRTTASTYDPDGNVLSTTRLAGTSGAVTDSFTYEPRYGRLATATNALGKTSSFAYNDDTNTVTATDPLGRRSITAMLAGQPVTITDPLGNTTYISYLDGAPVAVADPLGRVSTTYYDAAGRPIRFADPLRETTTLSYDSVNQVSTVVDPLGNTTRASYDADGNQLSLTDANGHSTTWTYDRMGRPLTRTDALGRTSHTGYDLLGRVVSAIDAKGAASTASYDTLGRLTSIAYGAAGTVTTGYDSANRPVSIVDSAGGTLTQTYDDLDRLTKQVSPQGTINYGYDKADRRTSMTVTGQTPVSYAFDSADELTSITRGTSVTRFGYDAGERRTSLTLPNGLVTSYGYDAAGQLRSLAYANGTTGLGDLAYTYDAAGRRTTMSGSYARTALPDPVAGAGYDAANELTQLGATTFSYDADGQLTGDGSATYIWDDRQHLTGITGATTASFGYDALGRRTSRTVGGASTGYLYDGGTAVQELAGTTPTANMVAGLGVDETYQRTDATGVHYPIADALGSTVAQTDG
ncbi:MAG TPA: DUF6531 domain-containing protein, partial [Rugosimonospora sp.]|nr:DUF6531 domain-containing protein [Rugosimonospora sp.]